MTVRFRAEARAARDAGADVVVLQGFEAGGHRASWEDSDASEELSVLALLRLVGSEIDLPLVAAGGIADGAAVAAVLAAGAAAAQVGTAFLRALEAGTNPAHAAALTTETPTAITRAFSGRRARSLVNRFLADHGAHAPAAYPHIHHATAPLRRLEPGGVSRFSGGREYDDEGIAAVLLESGHVVEHFGRDAVPGHVVGALRVDVGEAVLDADGRRTTGLQRERVGDDLR
ncbi:MAG TPA: nitronate monooxygenase [Gaiellaceae bacterium]|nr:nitronate monooxygenase [Gaiellaceae bacterium]